MESPSQFSAAGMTVGCIITGTKSVGGAADFEPEELRRGDAHDRERDAARARSSGPQPIDPARTWRFQ